MFSLKCLTKKFNRQSLSEVKPAPLSETVDHTASSPSSLSLSSKSTSTSTNFSPCNPTIYNTGSSRTTTTPTTTPHPVLSSPLLSPPSPQPLQQQQQRKHDSNAISTASTATNTDHTSSGMSTLSLQDHLNHFTSHTTSAEPENEDGIVDDPSCDHDDDNDVGSAHFLPSSPAAAVSSSSGESLSPSSPISSSDSEDEEAPPPLRVKARPHSPRKSPLQSQLKIERISSAEKRKYSQYKCSTGGSSSPSSSDDEIKEAFDPSSTSRSRQHYLHPHHHHHHNLTYSPPSIPHHPTAWGSGTKQGPSPFNSPSLVPTSPSSSSGTLSDPHHHHHSPLSGWGATTTAGVDPFEAASRPLKVLPVGRHKHKFFAQMSSGFDRPFLDFNKMQHSKRLVMVRRPMVIRNNSRVHSIQRPAPSSLQVSLDISQHCFQPVLS